MLRTKMITGVLTLPLMFGMLYIGGWPMLALALTVVCIGLHELYSGLATKSVAPAQWVGWLGAAGIMSATQWASDPVRSKAVMACLTGVVFLALMAQFRRREGTSAVANAGATVFGVGYVALLFSYILLLRHTSLAYLPRVEPDGGLDRLGALLLVVVPVWSMDIAANIIGKCFGRMHPWPNVSPNKTLAGSLAGLLASMVATVLLGGWLGMPVLHMLVLGTLMAVVGQTGDLCESMLKRDAGVKDLGIVLPGHGGVLDRFDSLLFAMPVAYYYLVFFVVPPGIT